MKLLIKVISACLFLGLSTSFLYSYRWMDAHGLLELSSSDLNPIFNHQPKDNSIIYDRYDKKIGEFYATYNLYTPIKAMPQFLIDAVVAIEDRDFFKHNGIDFAAMLRALIKAFEDQKFSQGASTITQQLVRNMVLTRERTLERKIKEIILAIRLEKQIDKNRILEIYLNTLFLGEGSYGVGAAARRYFDKPLSKLEPQELALIAGLFKSPSGYNPFKFPKKAKARQIQVLKAMASNGNITGYKASQLARSPLVYKKSSMYQDNFAAYFLDYVKEKAQKILGEGVNSKGLRIYTSLDTKLQLAAESTLKESQRNIDEAYRRLYEKNQNDPNLIETALVSIDPQTGEILAMYGGKDYNLSEFNRASQAKRPPGSAFKPAVYSYALAQGYKWSDMFYVSPISVDTYRPKNYDNQFLTETTLLRAFYKSINTLVIDLGEKLGVKNILKYAASLGVESDLRVEAGSLIGSSEVSMLDMARLYATFSNYGQKPNIIAIRKILDRNGKILYQATKQNQRVISPENAYLITEGLRSVLNFGTGYRYHDMATYSVGKSGTSDKAKDNWFCGYSSNNVTITWLGTDSPSGFTDGTSASVLALPIWANYMQKAASIYPPAPFEMPSTIETKVINPKFGNLDANGVTMHFIKGSTPTKTRSEIQAVKQLGSFRNLFDR